MFRKFILPLIALIGFAFAVYTVMSGAKPVIAAPPVAEPARSPFERVISGAGLVEASTQNIAVGTSIAGVIAAVDVVVGQKVKRGDALFRLDDRDRRALLVQRQALLATARAELQRFESLPRPEDLPPARARLSAAEAALADAQNQWALAESLDDKRAIATQEWDRRRFAVQNAEARVAELRAELAKLEAGAWASDLAVARARIAAAEADARAVEIDLERLVVRAGVDASVMQLNVRVGEFAAVGPQNPPLILLGDTDTLHVRVDIDENDAWRLASGARAMAYVRGNRELSTELAFVRIDPYVIPKRSLTGESTERVDTRVLQVLYRFDPTKLRVYPGQQMDVYIDAGAK